MANSFKQMLKNGTIKRRDSGMFIKLDDIHVQQGFNKRVADERTQQADDELFQYILTGGTVPPIYAAPPAPVSDPAVSDNSIHDLFLRAKAMMYQSGGSPIENSLNPVDAWLFEAEQATMLQTEPVSPDAEDPDDTVFTCPRCGRRSNRPNGEHYCHHLAAAARETAPKQETSND